jgi:uncharacterized protein YndB with AHSA1/START domain
VSDSIQPLVARVQMLIRRPVAEVFRAFVDPAVTSRFWFSRGSGRLEPGRRVRWEWEMYGASTEVQVREIEENRRILVEWDLTSPTLVEWTFEPRGGDATFVVVKNWGFHGDPDAVVARALDSAGGFSFVLAGLKAWLEHGIELRLTEDHAPDALVAGWRGRGEG